MRMSNLYNDDYKKKIDIKIKKIKYIIGFFSLLMIVVAITSILLSIFNNNDWLLFFNIPVDIMSMIVIFTLFQVYLPAYAWESKLARKTAHSTKKTVTGVITDIDRSNGFYDGQHMVSLTVHTEERSVQLYVRPWHYPHLFKEGNRYVFTVISKVIVSFESSDDI